MDQTVLDTLARAAEQAGGDFSLTTLVSSNGVLLHYVTHWLDDDCQCVGRGSLPDCLSAVRRYVERHRRRPTPDEVGRILGVA